MNYFLTLLASGAAQQEPFFLDWQWLLIFIVVVIILILALIDNTVLEDEHAVHGHGGHPESDDPTELAGRTDSALASDLAPEPAQAPEPMPKPEPEPAPAPARLDDLKRIEGIGPKVAALLVEAGITTFSALAAADLAQLQALLDANRLQMMDPSSWPAQAQLAASGDLEALQQLQDALKGGRTAN